MLLLHVFRESSNFLIYVKQENILILLHCIFKIENIFPGTQLYTHQDGVIYTHSLSKKHGDGVVSSYSRLELLN